MATQRYRSDFLISRRREQEDRNQMLLNVKKENTLLQAKALWEVKSTAICEHAQIKRRAEEYRREHAMRLRERQDKLLQMYLDEDAKYKQELVDRQETPEQRMERLAARAWELKSRREEERLKFVQEKKYQQWRMGEDVLRAEDSKLAELETLIQRDQQVFDKQLLKQQESLEEEMYDALIQKTYERMVDRECAEIADRARKNAATREVMDRQVELTRQRRAQEYADFLQLRADIKRQAEIEKAQGEERQLREEREKREKRAELDSFIREQRLERGVAEQREKEEDRQWVQSVLEREAQQEAMEQKEKERAARATADFRAAMALELQKQLESDAELERLQLEEQERQHAQRQAVWDKEEAARIRLLEEVYAGRAEQLMQKQAERDKIAALNEDERIRERAELARLQAIDERKRAIEHRQRLRLQEELFRQMDFHQVQRQREMQTVQLERRKAQLAEDALAEALNEEKEKQAAARRHILQQRAHQQQETQKFASAALSSLQKTTSPLGQLSTVAAQRTYPVAPTRHVTLAPWEK